MIIINVENSFRGTNTLLNYFTFFFFSIETFEPYRSFQKYITLLTRIYFSGIMCFSTQPDNLFPLNFHVYFWPNGAKSYEMLPIIET